MKNNSSNNMQHKPKWENQESNNIGWETREIITAYIINSENMKKNQVEEQQYHSSKQFYIAKKMRCLII